MALPVGVSQMLLFRECVGEEFFAGFAYLFAWAEESIYQDNDNMCRLALGIEFVSCIALYRANRAGFECNKSFQFRFCEESTHSAVLACSGKNEV